MVTLTKLLAMRMVASSRSGFRSRRLSASRFSSFSTLSMSLEVTEKNAVSLPDTKADANNATMAITMATMLAGSGGLMLKRGASLVIMPKI